MTPEQFYSAEIDRLRQDWEGGDYRAIEEAFALLSLREPAWPDWLRSAVLDGLNFAFEKGGAAGRGKSGGHSARARRADVEAMRWHIARLCLGTRDLGETRDDAFEAASEMLAGTLAQGSREAIEASFNRHQRRLRNSGN